MWANAERDGRPALTYPRLLADNFQEPWLLKQNSRDMYI